MSESFPLAESPPSNSQKKKVHNPAIESQLNLNIASIKCVLHVFCTKVLCVGPEFQLLHWLQIWTLLAWEMLP